MRAKRIVISGDRNQLGFISRVFDFNLTYSTFPKFHKITYQNISYRNPQDVYQLWFDKYAAGYFTTNRTAISMQPVILAAKQALRIAAGFQVLTFTQEEKKELIAKYPNVHTVHEVQGKTYKKVALVRLNPKKLALFDSEKFRSINSNLPEIRRC
uniref:(+)RNA virus helicase C-terminal domain-containing protein n=1 Tax=Panagrolaimus sp. JU765 TaxID=591449 RepID=A0AC34Q892_9BILA